MRSKQLNFYIVPEDRNIISEFLSSYDCYILADKLIQVDISYVDSLDKIPTEIVKVYLIRKQDLHQAKILTTDSGIKYYDNMRSPVLEFSLGGFYPYDSSLLQRARFYYIKEYYGEDEEIVKKSQEFIDWCDEVMKNFKKEFLKKYPKEKHFLYSKNAIEWIEQNKAEMTRDGTGWKSTLAS